MEQYLSNFNENLSNYQERADEKKIDLAKLGAGKKQLPLERMRTKLNEAGTGVGEGVMAGIEFGKAYMETKATEGIKNLMRRYGGRGGRETGTGAGGDEPIQMSAVRAEDFEAPAVAREAPAVAREAPAVAREAPVSLRPTLAREPLEYTEEGAGATTARAGQLEEAVVRGHSVKTAGELEQEQMREVARRNAPPPVEESFTGKYKAPTQGEHEYSMGKDTAMARQYAEKQGYTQQELSERGMRGSSTLARATKGVEAPVARELPDPMSVFKGTRYGEAADADDPVGTLGTPAYLEQQRPLPTRIRTTPRSYEQPDPEAVSGRIETAVAPQEAVIGARGAVARAGLDRYRGMPVERAEGDVADDAVAGGEGDLGDASSLLDMVGGWSGALSILGGAGMMAGIGLGIAGDIDASKEEDIQEKEMGQEEHILKHPQRVGFGSLAMPTYDTSTMRGGGGMGHF